MFLRRSLHGQDQDVPGAKHWPAGHQLGSVRGHSCLSLSLSHPDKKHHCPIFEETPSTGAPCQPLTLRQHRPPSCRGSQASSVRGGAPHPERAPCPQHRINSLYVWFVMVFYLSHTFHPHSVSTARNSRLKFMPLFHAFISRSCSFDSYFLRIYFFHCKWKLLIYYRKERIERPVGSTC